MTGRVEVAEERRDVGGLVLVASVDVGLALRMVDPFIGRKIVALRLAGDDDVADALVARRPEIATRIRTKLLEVFAMSDAELGIE